PSPSNGLCRSVRNVNQLNGAILFDFCNLTSGLFHKEQCDKANDRSAGNHIEKDVVVDKGKYRQKGYCANIAIGAGHARYLAGEATLDQGNHCKYSALSRLN